MRGLHFELPIYYFILFTALSFLLSWLLYFYNKKHDNNLKSNRLLFAIRFLFLILISLFLMRPKFQKSEIKTEKPILVFAQDVSESIMANKTDYFDKNKIDEKI